jgi:putative transposase
MPHVREAEEPVRRRLREISTADPRFGYRRAWAVLQREGFPVNRKRVQRLWREEGLRVPPQRLKRRRVGSSTVAAERLVAMHRNHVWALDFLFDAISDGRPIKALSMCDEHTRECIGDHVARSVTADDVVEVLDGAAAERGYPKFIRCDNGPEVVATAIRDWCRFSGTGASFIEPGSPWQKYVESFNARARDELFSREVFDTVREARVLYKGLASPVQPPSSGVDDASCVRGRGAGVGAGNDAVMHQLHHPSDTRAILRAVDGRNDVATTCNTWLTPRLGDTIRRHPALPRGRTIHPLVTLSEGGPTDGVRSPGATAVA